MSEEITTRYSVQFTRRRTNVFCYKFMYYCKWKNSNEWLRNILFLNTNEYSAKISLIDDFNSCPSNGGSIEYRLTPPPNLV